MMIDLIVCAVVLVSALVAFFRGFIREVLTILGVVGGLFAAYAFGDSLAPFYNGLMNVDVNAEGEEAQRFMGILPYTTLSVVLGYGTIFLGVVILLSVVSYFLSRFVENVGMGMLDRTLGVAFGLARGVILLGVLYLPVHMFVEKEDKESWFVDSRLHVYIEWTSEWLTGFLPKDFIEESAQEKIDETRETLKALEILPEAQKIISGEKRPQSSPAQDEPSSSVPVQGYDSSQRQSMEDLIEQQGQVPMDTTKTNAGDGHE